MADINRDDSVSPMTRIPNSDPPLLRIPQSLSTADIPTSSPLPVTPLPSSLRQYTEREPSDYLNGGNPHDQQFPIRSALTPDVPSSALPKRMVEIRVPSQDEDIAADPTSPGRRSVQFAQSDVMVEAPAHHSRQSSWDDAEARSRSERWISRLKSTLGSSGQIQTSRAADGQDRGESSVPVTPSASRALGMNTLDEEAGVDADVEESGDEAFAPGETPKQKRRRTRRPFRPLGMLTAPSSPRFPNEMDSPHLERNRGLIRRSTMPEGAEHRGGLSEGEGRDHLTGRRPAWNRGSSWLGTQRHLAGTPDDIESPSTQIIGHRRRISEMFGTGGGGASDGDVLSAPRRPFFGADRKTTFAGGVQKWKQVKNTLKALGKRKHDQIDYYKSAELMAELRAVTPAVVIFASMLQRDDNGNRRIPVLLEQLNLRVLNSRSEDGGESEKHTIFDISLEYGSGSSRMSWTVTRTIREIQNMHFKYRATDKIDRASQAATTGRKRPKQPHWPKREFPVFSYGRNMGSSSEEEKPPGNVTRANSEIPGDGHMTADEVNNAAATGSDTERRLGPGTRKKSRINQLLMRRQSSGLEAADHATAAMQNTIIWRKKVIDRQRRTLEKYLHEMTHWLMFRPDSGRFCHFLELSALGVRLAAEGNFHGKECFLHIQSSKGLDFRRVVTPASVIKRHSRKWFLVRQNYVVVVDSPATMNIYDVYLVDPTFRVVPKKTKLQWFGSKADGDNDKGKNANYDSADDDGAGGSRHTLKLYTSERKIRLFSRNQASLRQFEQSVMDMLKQTQWHQPHRFESFAPVRRNAFAQWLVDGRDYMWNVSRAINMAQDVIYIHDWWLSPELYLRRPPCISQKWRLDRLLQKKAREGVKIFVIVYRNVEQAVPIDSEYTKFSLLNLHDNIMVQRSPNQFKKNQFFYAHHEKICIVDHDVAFVGGIDLCFGRWDNPQHPLTDDRPTGMEADGDTPRDAEHCQLFPGKDYSNPRVLDFFKLNEPYEEMYDRSKVPRMPWHDISMQVVGQPARDLTRHFVQRWNYLRRERKPTRPMPFLLPPPDANHADLEALGLSGTCEVQILRSAGDWSLGLSRDGTECSIQNAYVKIIEESDHFVYIENQFFITSTETLNTRVVNRIGDALVERIIRAHENDEDWQACIIIPLVPGFQNTVKEADGSSVRLIMQFQYRSICRGPNSIFGRLYEAGINPHDYIRFFSLRQWGRIGSHDALVTEQLYIHAKTIIVDDRVALIGSANINERSMLGNRDSETAAIVRDTDMIWSTMAGRPYRVGRFAHTLRMRLQREHLGLDVDEITEEERQAEMTAQAQYEEEMAEIYREDEEDGETSAAAGQNNATRPAVAHGPQRSFNHDAAADDNQSLASKASHSTSSSSGSNSTGKSAERDARVQGNSSHERDVAGFGEDNWKEAQAKGLDVGSDTAIINGREVLLHRTSVKRDGQHERNSGSVGSSPARDAALHGDGKSNDRLPPPPMERRTTSQLGLPQFTELPTLPIMDDTDIGGPPVRLDENGKPTNKPLDSSSTGFERVPIDKDCMRDPINAAFWESIWTRIADNNTSLYRTIFRCMPDSEVKTWKDYMEYDDYAARFRDSMAPPKTDEQETQAETEHSSAAAPGISAPAAASDALGEQEHGEKTLAPKRSRGNSLRVRISSTNGEVIDEKAPASRDGRGLSLATNGLNEKQPFVDQPSPTQPTGDIPFPSYDPPADGGLLDTAASQSEKEKTADKRATFPTLDRVEPTTNNANSIYAAGSVKRRRRGNTRGSRSGGRGGPYELLKRDEAEEMCGMIQGHLVTFPYEWLEDEEKDNHWMFQADLLAPKEIYD
ncbi:phospholipase D1/2 [Microdochium nivale]|nr:phospholipase D1/2 [Microdochium nivale]